MNFCSTLSPVSLLEYQDVDRSCNQKYPLHCVVFCIVGLAFESTQQRSPTALLFTQVPFSLQDTFGCQCFCLISKGSEKNRHDRLMGTKPKTCKHYILRGRCTLCDVQQHVTNNNNVWVLTCLFIDFSFLYGNIHFAQSCLSEHFILLGYIEDITWFFEHGIYCEIHALYMP